MTLPDLLYVYMHTLKKFHNRMYMFFYIIISERLTEAYEISRTETQTNVFNIFNTSDGTSSIDM